MIPVRNYLLESQIVHGRIVLTSVGIILMALLLVFRVGYLQTSQHQRFAKLAQNNRIDLVPLPPVRGLIYGRGGEILAQNFRVYNLEILPDRVDDMDLLLRELGQLVELSEDNLERFRTLLKRRPSFERQTLRANLSEQEASRLAVDLYRHPGAELKARLQRNYPEGELTAHVVGYVGRISADNLEEIDSDQYRGLEYIGKTGIEAYYEHSLLGKSGYERLETNAHGKIIRSLEIVAPDAGKTIRLSLDIKLQQKSIEALEGFEGAVVAIEPETGDVLSFASVPGYDPNPFVNGISKQDYSELRASERLPLLNRALYGRYAPGSTIKGFMTLVGLDNGLDPDKTINCIGFYRLPGRKHRYRDWKKSGHGLLDARGSIEQSCDVYFYRLAKQLGIDQMHDGMSRFGFGQVTGIDLLNEPTGLMPSREWKRRVRDQTWYPGETIITGIGQGYMLVTPIQLAAATATLANRGKQVTPRFLTTIENPQNQTQEKLEPQFTGYVKTRGEGDYEYAIGGMHDVVHGKRGTARRIGRNIKYQKAGKTGTAQVVSIAQNEVYNEATTAKKFRDHSLFIGFAPLEQPKIAIAVIIEHGGSGSRTAAPIARKLIDYYLLERLKLFAEPAPSPESSKTG